MIPAKEIVAIGGNHDWIIHDGEIPTDLPWHYLQDSSVVIGGIKFYGTPWQPPFFDWAWNAPEDKLMKIFKNIPKDTDVLVTHCPPRMIGDETLSGDHVGSTSLSHAIERVEPKLNVFGHIHPASGLYKRNGSYFANASIVNSKYQVVNSPMEFDITEQSECIPIR
jgi:Icc-related predicted phosphoesterase